MCKDYIRVHILDVPYQADWEYTYSVPEELRQDVEIGTAVVVPFGKANRKNTAIVVATGAKPICSVLSGYFKLSQEMLELCSFMKLHTLCTFGEAVKCIIPSAIVTKTKELFRVTGNGRMPDGELGYLYELIENNPNITLEKLKQQEPNAQALIQRLIRMGAVKRKQLSRKRIKASTKPLFPFVRIRKA